MHAFAHPFLVSCKTKYPTKHTPTFISRTGVADENLDRVKEQGLGEGLGVLGPVGKLIEGETGGLEADDRQSHLALGVEAEGHDVERRVGRLLLLLGGGRPGRGRPGRRPG